MWKMKKKQLSWFGHTFTMKTNRIEEILEARHENAKRKGRPTRK